MDLTPLGQIIEWLVQAHKETLSLAEGLSEEEFAWQPHPSATSVAFNVWHLARWADYVQWRMPETTPVLSQRLEPRQQVWRADNLATRWELDASRLGEMEAGNELGVAAAQIHLPGRDIVLEYLRRCYTLEEETLTALDAREFQEHRTVGAEWPEQPVGQWLMSHLVHEWEHLGMIRYVQGLYDLRKAKSGAA